MNNGNINYKLIKTHIRSIETLINKIPELNHLSASNRKQTKIKLLELEEKFLDFVYWNNPKQK